MGTGLAAEGLAAAGATAGATATLSGVASGFWTACFSWAKDKVEKETAAKAERSLISGVFSRRLTQGMMLQTDPTVIYGMGDSYQGNIRSEDLHTETPYNTYKIKGLPPTPIAMPGREAIYAALHPDHSNNSIYFVSRGDGTHVFSATLDEHNQAVNQFQRQKP